MRKFYVNQNITRYNRIFKTILSSDFLGWSLLKFWCDWVGLNEFYVIHKCNDQDHIFVVEFESLAELKHGKKLPKIIFILFSFSCSIQLVCMGISQ